MQITVYACDECGKENKDSIYLRFISVGRMSWTRNQDDKAGDKHFCSAMCGSAWFEKLLDKIEKEGR